MTTTPPPPEVKSPKFLGSEGQQKIVARVLKRIQALPDAVAAKLYRESVTKNLTALATPAELPQGLQPDQIGAAQVANSQADQQKEQALGRVLVELLSLLEDVDGE